MGILGLIPSLFSIFPEKRKNLSDFQIAATSASTEIRRNIRWLDTLRRQMEANLDWPICQQTHVATGHLFQNYFCEMGWKTYGQDNALLRQWKSIGKHTDDLNRSDSLDALRSAEGKSEMSLRDLYFQNAFMLFYLEPFLATKGRNDRKMGSRTPEFYTSIPESSWKQWRAKTTVDYEGKKISTFGDWLALID